MITESDTLYLPPLIKGIFACKMLLYRICGLIIELIISIRLTSNINLKMVYPVYIYILQNLLSLFVI